MPIETTPDLQDMQIGPSDDAPSGRWSRDGRRFGAAAVAVIATTVDIGLIVVELGVNAMGLSGRESGCLGGRPGGGGHSGLRGRCLGGLRSRHYSALPVLVAVAAHTVSASIAVLAVVAAVAVGVDPNTQIKKASG